MDVAGHPVARGEGQMNQADRLFGRAAARPGDAGDGDGQVGGRCGEGAPGHGADSRLAHRAVALDRRRRHAEDLPFGGVGIGDEAAVDDGGGAGDVREGGGDATPGTGLGRGDHPAARPCGPDDIARQDLDVRPGHRQLSSAQPSAITPASE